MAAYQVWLVRHVYETAAIDIEADTAGDAATIANNAEATLDWDRQRSESLVAFVTTPTGKTFKVILGGEECGE